MPERRGVRVVDSTLCRRCQIDAPVITARNESFCQACFCKYVVTKVIKRMEAFRVRYAEPDDSRFILLPLSLGPSSSSLLQILSQHLRGQTEKTGRTGFKLHVLHVEDDVTASASDDLQVRFDAVKSRYPEHTYSTSKLSGVISLDEVRSLPVFSEHSAFGREENAAFLSEVLASLDSPTARRDMLQTSMRKLIVTTAKANHCEAILWGDNTTTLAERVLADTAKGRGSSLPWTVADGISLHSIAFHYPLRDLLSQEIVNYASLIGLEHSESMSDGLAKVPVNLKNTTIDDLMRQYFKSVEREYPSIVANVVKTTGKLTSPSLSSIETQCELCDVPLDGQGPDKSRLCYACIRVLPASNG